ncbi:MAG: hypothetical protein KME64_00190 [Scytonematopsis contorta HA4267-MV1]|nr:hypothetical protein [Scytonematopsis contorta HA4267-MV1]
MQGKLLHVRAIEQLAAQLRDIKIELSVAPSVKSAIQLLTQPNDIVIGSRTLQTLGIIEYAASLAKAVASYIPETTAETGRQFTGTRWQIFEVSQGIVGLKFTYSVEYKFYSLVFIY